MHLPIFPRILALVPLFLTLVGCATVVRPAEQFDSTSRDFLQRLRWKDYSGAATFLIEENRAPFLDEFLPLEDLHITDARLESVEKLEAAAGDRRVRTRVAIEYYLLPSPAVKTRRMELEWQYQGGDRTRAGEWRIVTPFPPFP